MKKLLIAVSIVCAATFSQAASYNWSAQDIATGWGAGGSSENVANGTAYLFLAAAGSTTYTDVSTAVAGGNFFANGWDSQALTSAAFAGNLDATSTDGLAGVTGDSFFAVFVSDSWTEYQGSGSGPVSPEMAYVSTAVTPGEVKSIGPTILAFANQFDVSKQTGAWTANPVPEPTSGLLVLLGMAGLMLRRKRA